MAVENGRDLRRGDFARWHANALAWGNSDAGEGIRTIEELLRVETRRSTRAAMLGALMVLHSVLGDRAGVEAADAAVRAINQELGERPHLFRHAFAQYALGNLPEALAGAQAEAAELEKLGETGQRSTMLSLQGWVLALMGRNEEALAAAERGREIGAADDAVTQMLWRTAAGLAQAQLGNLEEAARLTDEAIEVAGSTDSVNVADAWEARAHVLWMLGRRDEMLEAAARARELHAQKGSVTFLRRLDAFLASAGIDAGTRIG